MKSKASRIYLTLTAFFVLFVLNFFLDFTKSQILDMFVLLTIFTMVLSVFLLKKYKLPKAKYILLSLLFGILVYIANFGSGCFVSFTQILCFLSTFLGSMASFRVFQTYTKDRIFFARHDYLKSILIGLLVGIILGAINYFTFPASYEKEMTFTLEKFLKTLNPAIYEEIACRTIFYAFCLHLLGGTVSSKRENNACFILMIIPHAISHTPEVFLDYGIIQGICSTLILAFVFGLPLAYLQKKRDVLSAMIAHYTIDFIRFVIFGA